MGDMINKTALIRGLNNLAVSTNPSNFKANEKFTRFMDDPEISSFGKWERANGYDIALINATTLAEKLSKQPKPLSDDDIETIRIHLQAELEGLCNQGRWNEAKEYQGLIDRFKACFC